MTQESKRKKIDVRVKRTYEQLTVAMIELLAKKSFDDLTVLEICNRAKVHRATFYKHFIDKHDFLNCCFKMKLAELDLGKSDKEFSIERMNENCMKMIEKVLTFVADNKEFVTCVSTDHFSPSFTNSLSDAIAEFIIEQIKAKANFSDKLGYNLQLMAHYYAGAIVGLAHWWSTSENVCSKQMFLEFAKIKIDDLCNYFESFAVAEKS